MEHFVFWGLFLAFFVIILFYWMWMIRAEREELPDPRVSPDPRSSPSAPEGGPRDLAE